MTVIHNEKNELIPQCTVTSWQMCIDYQKLNKATRKDHFSLPFIDEMLERLANHSFFCYLEWREKAYHGAMSYKERTKRWHDKRIKTKQFKPGGKVFLFNSRVHFFGHGKLHSKREGPYLILYATGHGAVTLQCDDGIHSRLMANALNYSLSQRLKLFRTRSLLVWPQIHRSMRISATFSCWTCHLLVGQHSALYNMIGRITVL
jgi:hypothetical protein